MNVQVIGYRNYGVLGYEKQPFYTINRPSPLAVVSEKVIFSLPEKWKTARNQAGTILIESPDGRTWIAEQILVNRHRGNEQPRLDADGFKFYLGVEPLTIEKPIPEPIKKEPCQIIGIQFPLENGPSHLRAAISIPILPGCQFSSPYPGLDSSTPSVVQERII